MSDQGDKFWQEVARGLARKANVAPLSPEQAQEVFDALPDAELSDAEIDSTIERVTSGELADWTPEPLEIEPPEVDTEVIEDDVHQLNRNEGDADAETDELLNELRRKALEDGSSDGQADSTEMGGDSEPPEEGD